MDSLYFLHLQFTSGEFSCGFQDSLTFAGPSRVSVWVLLIPAFEYRVLQLFYLIVDNQVSSLNSRNFIFPQIVLVSGWSVQKFVRRRPRRSWPTIACIFVCEKSKITVSNNSSTVICERNMILKRWVSISDTFLQFFYSYHVTETIFKSLEALINLSRICLFIIKYLTSDCTQT